MNTRHCPNILALIIITASLCACGDDTQGYTNNPNDNQNNAVNNATNNADNNDDNNDDNDGPNNDINNDNNDDNNDLNNSPNNNDDNNDNNSPNNDSGNNGPGDDPDMARAQEAFDAVAEGLDEARFDTPEAMEAWAGFSAPNLMLASLTPRLEWETLKTLWTEMGNDGLPDCPQTEGLDENGNEASPLGLVGGCTDFTGAQWSGSWLPVTGAFGSIRYVYDDFGVRRPVDGCLDAISDYRLNGVLDIVPGPSGATFEPTITYQQEGADPQEDCLPSRFTLAFSGQFSSQDQQEEIERDGMTQQTNTSVYNSQALVAMRDDEHEGIAMVSTQNEHTNSDICQSEALEGSTTFTTDTQEAIITYDGRIDCDPASTVTWTLDGMDQGTLEGVGCAIGQRTAPKPWLPIIFALVALVLVRRRTPKNA